MRALIARGSIFPELARLFLHLGQHLHAGIDDLARSLQLAFDAVHAAFGAVHPGFAIHATRSIVVLS